MRGSVRNGDPCGHSSWKNIRVLASGLAFGFSKADDDTGRRGDRDRVRWRTTPCEGLRAFKRFAEAFTLGRIVTKGLAISLELGYGTIVFTKVAKPAGGPKVFERVRSASAQWDSVLDVPISRLLGEVFANYPLNPSPQ